MRSLGKISFMKTITFFTFQSNIQPIDQHIDMFQRLCMAGSVITKNFGQVPLSNLWTYSSCAVSFYSLCIPCASAFLLGLALHGPYAAVVRLKRRIRNKSYKIFRFDIPCLFIQLHKAFSPTKAHNSPRAFRGKNLCAAIHQTGTKIFIPARFFRF